MRLIILVVVFFLSICQSLNGQNNDYEPIKSSGKVPKEFRTPTQEKVETQKKQIPYNMNYREKELLSDFALKSNYYVDQLLLSGKVLFNDPVSQYLEDVGQEVIKNETESFRDSIKFFVLRSDLSNAFATQQGLVFVTVGLINQLQNEAELAFILAHEVGHIKKKHIVGNYLKSQRLIRDGKNRYVNYNNLIEKLSDYSKEAEFEADSMGYAYISKSEYSLNALLSVFSVLEYSYLPLDEFKYDISYLEAGEYSFDSTLLENEFTPIDFNKEIDDNSTHPSALNRKTRISQYAKEDGVKLEKKKDYIVGKNRFKHIQKLARYETIRMNLRDRNYIKSLYNIQFLKKHDPDSEYLLIAECKALYGLSKYKTYEKSATVITDWKKVEGNISRLNKIMNRIDKKEFSVLILNYIFEINRNLNSPHLKALVDDLISDLITMYDVTIEDISKNAHIKQVSSNDNDSAKQSDEVRYYSILKPVLNDTSFTTRYSSIQKRLAEKALAEEKAEESFNNMAEHEKRRHFRKLKKQSLHYGIKSLIILDPFYFVMSDRLGFELLNSDEAQIKFNTRIEKIARKSGITVNMISSRNIEEDESNEFNELSALYDWVGERLSHEKLPIRPSEQEYLSGIAKKYNSSHLMLTGVIGYKAERKERWEVLLYTAICYPLFPFGVYYALTPQNHSYFYSLILNLTNGEITMNIVEDVPRKSNKGTVNSYYYNLFNQMQYHPDK